MANASELYAAASSGEIDTIYRVIEQDPRILEEIDAIPFVNTPLHAAAYAGHVEFSIEIMRLKPSFGSKLNQQGSSPIHIALGNNQHNVVRRLVEINKELVRVKGREGVTPLHLVCQSGDSEENITLLIDLLVACPDSIKDVNVRNETALHIVLIKGNMKAFRVLISWFETNVYEDAIKRSILNWKDSAGNTILHVATQTDNKEAVDLLMIAMEDQEDRNSEHQTAFDFDEILPLPIMAKKLLKFITKREPRLFISLLREPSYLEKMLDHIQGQLTEEQRNAYMVVATLIVTAVYQSVLSPPGGLIQGGTDIGPNSNNLLNSTSTLNSTAAGKIVMAHKVFSAVKSLNGIIFMGGIMIIIAVMPKPSHAFTSTAIMLLILFIASYFVSQSVISP